MKTNDLLRIWLTAFGFVLAAGIWIYFLTGAPDRIYTEDWTKARQFAHKCESDGGSYLMKPHWRKGEDKPYAATVTCRDRQ